MRTYNKNAWKCFFDNIKTVPCKRCRQDFERTSPSAKYCSIKCRFLSKVDVTEHCHEWLARLNHKGYGQFRIDGKMTGAHRAAYCIFIGDIPDGMHVLHYCDNPKCVNPEHLWLGTNQDNVDDKMRKGRIRYGPNHPRWDESAPQHGRSIKHRKIDTIR